MRRVFIAVAALALFGVTAIGVNASSGSSHNARPSVGGSFSDGPYASMSADSGTCGNAWAIDVYNRQFTIKPQNNDGSWTVVETFAKAKFMTLGDGQSGPGQSPDACDGANPGNNGHVLAEGIAGTFKGTFTIIVNSGFSFVGNGGCGTLSDWPQGANNGLTPGDCTTGSWIATHFPGAVYGSDANVTKFNFTYKASVNGTKRTWTNADTGNVGDIYSS